MNKLNSRLDAITKPFMEIVPWLPRLALGIAFFFHGYGKLPAPFMTVSYTHLTLPTKA